MKQNWEYSTFRQIMTPAKVERCKSRTDLPILSITMRDGIVFQSSRFKKVIASVSTENYKIVRNGQLVIAFPIDEGLIYTQDVVEMGIMSPAYNVWNVDYTKVERRFLVKYFHSPNAMRYYKLKLRGTTQRRRNLPKEDLLSMPIPIPPLSVQSRIVAELDLLTGIVDKQNAQLKELDNLAQAIFYDMFGDPIENPKGWNISHFSDICEVTSSKRVYQSEWQSSGIPFLRISDFSQLTESNDDIDAELFISKEKYDELKLNDQVPSAGDILVTARGTLGVCYIVKKKDCFYFQDGMITWLKNLDERVLSQFVVFLFKNHSFRRQIDKSQSGSTVAYLSISMLKKFVLPVPPLALQQSFAEKIQSIENQKAKIKTSIAETQKLLDYTMDKYFG